MTANRIPLIPSWSAIVPLLVNIVHEGTTAGGRMAAREELARVAGIADAADVLTKAVEAALQLLRDPDADTDSAKLVEAQLAMALERIARFDARGAK